jgi:RNA polymerase sigma-70 factor, ECF subfamily
MTSRGLGPAGRRQPGRLGLPAPAGRGRALVRLAARRQPDPPLRPEVLDFWRAVRSLPSRQRQAVALFYLEDWPVAEIARFLGCTETTVRGHLHRGRATLARRLGEAWKEEEP